ncbi:MAG: DNA translocase FtsK [Verrucomicrobiota bacterium]
MASSRAKSPRSPRAKKKPPAEAEPTAEPAPPMSPRIVREVAAVLWLGAALLTLLALISYDTNDLGLFSTQPNDPPFNFIGIVGAYWSMALFMSLGVAGYLVPILFFCAGVAMLVHTRFRWSWKLPLAATFLVSASCLLHVHGWMENWTRQVNAVSSGGFVGQWLDDYVFVALLGPVGTMIVLWTVYAASVLFLFELDPRKGWRALATWWKDSQQRRREERLARDPEARAEAEREEMERKRRELEAELQRMAAEGVPIPTDLAPQPNPDLAIPDEPTVPPEVIDASRPRRDASPRSLNPDPDPKLPPVPDPTTTPSEDGAPPALPEKKSPKRSPVFKGRSKRESVRHAGEAGEGTAGPLFEDYQLPGFELLEINQASGEGGMNEAELRANSDLLIRTLAEFGIKAQPGPITKGATITRYEVIPATGVRVGTIKNLERDISRVMKAERVNILAPIPGKDSVGVEVANTKKVPIVLHDLLESPAWKQSKAKIPIALGKDVYGQTLIADLAEMPHLLIAGTTGSGKSVCINSLLMSLMYKFNPDELRLILVDPKQVEMQVYNTVPHLVVPVVTEAKKVLLALRWVIQEMEQRYRILAKAGVRNITSFNKRKREEPKPAANGDDEPELIEVPRDDDLHIPDKLPFIVVIIDELADLMQTAPADVESAIARLTAKARAAGIHLVVATQTPRREVITGVIKTNIPSRVAFQVPSALDSRVILDENGAENLLGKGDLLYLPPGSSKLVRGQGAFVSDEEVQAVVDFCAAQCTPDFDEGIQKKMSGDREAISDVSDDDLELLEKSLEVVRQEKKASTSMLQRRLRLGYNRAAWVMDKFQELGIISAPDPDNPARPREILVELETYELPGG